MKFHTILYWACDYLSLLGLKLILVSKGAPGIHVWGRWTSWFVKWTEISWVAVRLRNVDRCEVSYPGLSDPMPYAAIKGGNNTMHIPIHTHTHTHTHAHTHTHTHTYSQNPSMKWPRHHTQLRWEHNSNAISGMNYMAYRFKFEWNSFMFKAYNWH